MYLHHGEFSIAGFKAKTAVRAQAENLVRVKTLPTSGGNIATTKAKLGGSLTCTANPGESTVFPECTHLLFKGFLDMNCINN